MFDGIPLYILQFSVLKYLDLIGIVLLMGILSFQTFVFEPTLKLLSDEKYREEMKNEAFVHDRPLARFLILFLIGLQIVTFTHQVELMSAQFPDRLPSLLWITLTNTSKGWLVSAKLVVLILILFLHRFIKFRLRILCLFAISLLCLNASLSGHAVEQGLYAIVLSDWVHFTAASIWIGGLIPLRRLSRKSATWLKGKDYLIFLSNLVSRFSQCAILAVSIILMTGLLNASLYYFSSPNALMQDYLTFFSLKMILVVIALAFGAAAQFYLLPLLLKNKTTQISNSPAVEKLFYRVVSGELLTVLLILVMVSLITQLEMR